MRPSAIFKEYEEIENDVSISFSGVLHQKYLYIPKSQLAFSISGNKECIKYRINRSDQNVSGIIIKLSPEYTGNEMKKEKK